MSRPQQEQAVAILKTGHIVGIVASAVGCIIILVWTTYRIIERSKGKSSPSRKKAMHVLPWLSSNSPVYISRPLPTLSEEKLCSNPNSQYGAYAQPMTYSPQGLTISLEKCATWEPAHQVPLNKETFSVSKRSQPVVVIAAARIPPSPPALPDRPLPAHTFTAHTRSLSVVNKPYRDDKRVISQGLTSKPLARGKTILIHNDIKTRPSSVYSNDDQRISVYPTTPSDLEHSFSGHITPVASRHASFMMPEWQNEPMPEVPGIIKKVRAA